MVKTIHKFDIEKSHGVVETHEGAVVLDVQQQHGSLMLWMLVDTSAPPARRKFRIVGTGHPVDAGLEHVATVQVPPFVWHVFEDKS